MDVRPRFLVLLIGIVSGFAATVRDDAHADDEFLWRYAETYRFSLGEPTQITITDDGASVLFLRSGPRSFVHDLFEYDAMRGEERRLASAAGLLGGAGEELTAEELARRERMRSTARGIASFEVSRDGRQILVPLSGKLFVLDRESGDATPLPISAGSPVDPTFSPDARRVAYVCDGDLYVLHRVGGQERRLTSGASETLTHGLAEFVAQEEMSRMRGYWWSPDSKQLVYQRTDTSAVEEWFIGDAIHPERKATAWRYPRPGRENADVRLGIIGVEGGETTWIDWDRNAYPYVAAVTWTKNAPLTVLVQNRRQTEQVLLAVDPTTGAAGRIHTERDEAWLNLDHAMPRWLAKGDSFLWSSERGGGWQLELRGRDGRLAGTLTEPELNYRGLVGVDEAAKAVFVLGGENPAESHLYRVSLDPRSGEAVRLTTDPGMHSAVYAKRGGTSIRIQRPLEGAPRFDVLRGDGTAVGELKSVAEAPPEAPKVELTVTAVEPALPAAIIRPRDFRPGQKYPVIVNVYGGPGAQMVVARERDYLLNQWLADQGFIVVRIDGRGSGARGRAWERSVRGNLIDLPLSDQVRGLQALGEKYEELDLSRVGIFGWSFGGYFSAHAVMQRPDVFHVGIVGAPVTDFRDYDTHYTERFLGLPAENEAGYVASSVLSHVEKLRRPLLVIHGTADDNVYFLHSMKLCDALFRAGKNFEFLPLAGFTHMVPDPTVTVRLQERMAEFFRRHLQHGEPLGR